jgi:hypothetical protein
MLKTTHRLAHFLKSEELQKNKNELKFDGKPSEVTTLKLIHELEVHQRA